MANGILFPESIRKHLPDGLADIPVHAFSRVDSTNTLARRLACLGARHGTIVTAAEQTAGRGRVGRSFFSPATGLYMSVVLLHGREEDALVTIRAAAAVCRAIERVLALSPRIKWVNDIFLDGRKAGGILAETAPLPSGERAVIVGVGLNLATDPRDFPDELKTVAGTLGAPPAARGELIAKIAEELLLAPFDALKEYRSRSMLFGQAVTYALNGEQRRGIAEGVNELGNLLVRTPSGSVDVLQSGEVSLGSAHFTQGS